MLGSSFEEHDYQDATIAGIPIKCPLLTASGKPIKFLVPEIRLTDIRASMCHNNEFKSSRLTPTAGRVSSCSSNRAGTAAGTNSSPANADLSAGADTKLIQTKMTKFLNSPKMSPPISNGVEHGSKECSPEETAPDFLTELLAASPVKCSSELAPKYDLTEIVRQRDRARKNEARLAELARYSPELSGNSGDDENCQTYTLDIDNDYLKSELRLNADIQRSIMTAELSQEWPGLNIFPNVPLAKIEAFALSSFFETETVLYGLLLRGNPQLCDIDFPEDILSDKMDPYLLLSCILTVLLSAGADINYLYPSVIRGRDHILSKAEETIFAVLGNTANGFCSTNGELMSDEPKLSLISLVEALPMLENLSGQVAIVFFAWLTALSLEKSLRFDVRFHEAVRRYLNDILEEILCNDWPEFMNDVTVLARDWLISWERENVIQVTKLFDGSTMRGRCVRTQITREVFRKYCSVPCVTDEDSSELCPFELAIEITSQMPLRKLLNDEPRLAFDLTYLLGYFASEEHMENASRESLQRFDDAIYQAILAFRYHSELSQATKLRQLFGVLRFRVAQHLKQYGAIAAFSGSQGPAASQDVLLTNSQPHVAAGSPCIEMNYVANTALVVEEDSKESEEELLGNDCDLIVVDSWDLEDVQLDL